jgi:hypothetical protein
MPPKDNKPKYKFREETVNCTYETKQKIINIAEKSRTTIKDVLEIVFTHIDLKAFAKMTLKDIEGK